MNDNFEWHVDLKDDAWGEQNRHQPAPQRPMNPAWFMLIAVLLVGGVLGGWYAGQRQIEQSEEELRIAIQKQLDSQRDAFSRGDGDLYFSAIAEEAAWRAAHLLPANLAAARAGFTVTRAQSQGDVVWANVSWEENGRSLQRITFWQRLNGQWKQMPTDAAYWGRTVHSRQSWGTLTYSEIDEPFVDSIAAQAAESVAAACAANCVQSQIPFTLVLTPDYGKTAVPNTIHLPSPRLLGLAENGQPGRRYHERLRQAVADLITPAAIRFALPPFEVPGQPLLNYNQLAEAFMAAHPHITVELVQLERLPANLAELSTFDGAAITPTADMIAAGLVVDLTDFAASDPEFYQTDFYEVIWQSAIWQDRLWFVPQMADLRLLYYDKAAYQLAGWPEPSWQWSWTDMEADMVAMIAAQPPDSPMEWGFLDVGRDSLFAYAYNESQRCQRSNCPTALQPQHVLAALTWYEKMVPNQMPDVSDLTAYEREEFLLSKQSARRHAAIWVDEPIMYENHLLLSAVGVAPFPGLELSNGATPLWVEGNFISAESKRPYAVWQWLTFLSKEPPLTGFRRIPARPSVAAQNDFWFILPRALADPMRAAFNNARAVTIMDRLYFEPALVTAVATGQRTPLAVSQIQPQVNWFGERE